MAKIILTPMYRRSQLEVQAGRPIVLNMGKHYPVYKADGNTNNQTKSLTKTATTQAIGGHRAVIAVGATGVDYAEANNLIHAGLVLGITTTAAVQGASAVVQTSGEIEYSGWAFTPNKPVFVGSNGHLTQAVPSPANSKFQQQIGTALSANKLHIQIFQPTKLT